MVHLFCLIQTGIWRKILSKVCRYLADISIQNPQTAGFTEIKKMPPDPP
jgi:hypothetical protein